MNRAFLLFATPAKRLKFSKTTLKTIKKDYNLDVNEIKDESYTYELMVYKIYSKKLTLYSLLYKVRDERKIIYKTGFYFTDKETEKLMGMCSYFLNATFEPHEHNCLTIDGERTDKEIKALIKTWKQENKTTKS